MREKPTKIQLSAEEAAINVLNHSSLGQFEIQWFKFVMFQEI